MVIPFGPYCGTEIERLPSQYLQSVLTGAEAACKNTILLIEIEVELNYRKAKAINFGECA